METRLQTLDILKDFHRVTGARISLHDLDFNEVASYPSELSAFCRTVQNDSKALKSCHLGDESAFQTAKRTGVPYTYKCHCGLIETVAPIYNFGTLTGYFMMGQITDDLPDSKQNIIEKSKQYITDADIMNEVCDDIPVIKNDLLISFINLLEIVAEYMTGTNRMTAKNRDLAAEIKSYLIRFYSKPLTIRDLSETFGCSRTTLMNVFKKRYSMTVFEFLTEYRLKQAEKMLKSGDRSIKSITIACGFIDQNYFTKVFKAEYGVTPTEYRMKNLQG